MDLVQPVRASAFKWEIDVQLFLEVNTSEVSIVWPRNNSASIACSCQINTSCVWWSLSKYTQDVCTAAMVGLERRCCRAGGSGLYNIWGQLDRAWVWTGFKESAMGTCRIGGLRPFGKTSMGSHSVSDTKVSGVSQLMIQGSWSYRTDWPWPRDQGLKIKSSNCVFILNTAFKQTDSIYSQTLL